MTTTTKEIVFTEEQKKVAMKMARLLLEAQELGLPADSLGSGWDNYLIGLNASFQTTMQAKLRRDGHVGEWVNPTGTGFILDQEIGAGFLLYAEDVLNPSIFEPGPYYARGMEYLLENTALEFHYGVYDGSIHWYR